MTWVIGLSILGCWVGSTPGLLLGAAIGMVIDDLHRSHGGPP